jgi:hypothetical protein
MTHVPHPLRPSRRGNPIRATRRGYAMVTVLIFLMLSLVLVSICQRRLAAVLRMERARMHVELRDEGSVHALARGLELLETGPPPADPYTCATHIETSQGTRSYTIVYASAGGNQWTVTAAPTPDGENPPPLPVTFAP